MESLYRLRHAPQKFKGVVISHDLTRAERDARKIKVDEAQAMEQADTSGEYWYRVRGNPGQLRIIKNKKKELGNTEREPYKLKILRRNVEGLSNEGSYCDKIAYQFYTLCLIYAKTF